jgi:hypothetical protein
VRPRKVKKLDPQGSLRENAARIVATRLAELRDFAPEALRPESAVAQHDMRIAAKRLRYVLEVTGVCFGDEAAAVRGAAKRLQTLLGEIHDCDVMLPRVRATLEGVRAEDVRAVLVSADGDRDLDPALVGRAPNGGAYRGLELLAVHLRARRALLFERFRDLWKSEFAAGTWSWTPGS